MRRDIHDFVPDLYLFAAVLVLLLGFVSQFAAFPLQIILVIYGLSRMDVRFMPGLYISLLDAAYFPFTGLPGILKFNIVIPLSVLNVFCITTFLLVVIQIFKSRMDRKSLSFVPFWLLMAIPALVIALQGRADGVLSNWQTPLIYLLIPSLYYWGILVGRTWERGRVFFLKRFLIIFILQVGMEVLGIYRPGCEFQNHIIPIAFGFAVGTLLKSIVWKLIGCIGVVAGICGMLFERYIENTEMYQVSEETAIVSTFTRLAVVIIGLFVLLTAGKIIRGRQMRILPWVMLLFCLIVFTYAVARANTTNQSAVVTTSLSALDSTSMFRRFEMKLVGDRGSVWSDAFHNELFESPLIFKRLKDKEFYHPILGRNVTKMAPHNQFLTLVCRMGWWLGLSIVLFLWWMHVREFRMAAMIDDDRPTLMALLAPSVAIFVAVGLSGQHVFTQMWFASSMASLTFPGILYGAAYERINYSR